MRGADSLRSAETGGDHSQGDPGHDGQIHPCERQGAAGTVLPPSAAGLAVLLLAADPLVLVPCTWDWGTYWAADGLDSASWRRR